MRTFDVLIRLEREIDLAEARLARDDCAWGEAWGKRCLSMGQESRKNEESACCYQRCDRAEVSAISESSALYHS
jgi:hypothetical protein